LCSWCSWWSRNTNENAEEKLAQEKYEKSKTNEDLGSSIFLNPFQEKGLSDFFSIILKNFGESNILLNVSIFISNVSIFH